jgi:hypothetical protein
VVVACLYLSTAHGRWLLGDHAEMIVMAHRLVSAGTFTLAPDGEAVPELSWRPATRARFFPGTAIALAPFALLDHLAGLYGKPDLGRWVHLGGLTYTLLALALVALAVRRAGGSEAGTAMAVLLLGTSWPLWQIARNGGAEPVLAALIALFLWGSVTRSTSARAWACLLLPWTHPTGTFLALALALAEPTRWDADGTPGRSAWPGATRLRHVALTLLAAASVALLWNLVYHGHLRSGGYAAAHVERLWFVRPFWQELFDAYLSQCALMVPLLSLLAIAACLADRRRLMGVLWLALAPLLVIAVFFSIFTPTVGQDPERRLSMTWLGFAMLLGLGWQRLGIGRALTWSLIALNVALALFWFRLREFTHYSGPRGTGALIPDTAWLTWWAEGKPAWLWAGYLAVLALVLVLALARLEPVFAPRDLEARTGC